MNETEERGLFEGWYRASNQEWGTWLIDRQLLVYETEDGLAYANHAVQTAWTGWKARASIATENLVGTLP